MTKGNDNGKTSLRGLNEALPTFDMSCKPTCHTLLSCPCLGISVYLSYYVRVFFQRSLPSINRLSKGIFKSSSDHIDQFRTNAFKVGGVE